MTDMLVRDGTVIDGTGAEPRRADIRVRGAVFVEIGCDLMNAPGEHVVEAAGREVLPGFVDVHAHDDAALLRPGGLTPKVSQGVTLTVIGNCGQGCAPSGEGTTLRDLSLPILGEFPPERFEAFTDYLDALDRAELAVDAAALVPHGPLRAAVLGMQRRPADAAEVSLLQGFLGEALRAGAAGCSIGLMYPPGDAASHDELRAIATTVARTDRLLVAHVRNEADRLEESIEEFLDLGRATGCRLHISHLKVTGPKNFGTMPRVIDRLESARGQGVDVTADVYPYHAGSTTAASLFPGWARGAGTASLWETLEDRRGRARVLAEMGRPWKGGSENTFHSAGPAAIRLAGFRKSENLRYEGSRLSDIATVRGQEAAECLVDLMREEDATLTVVLFHTDLDGVRTALEWPHTLVGSDGLPREHGYVYPRLFGTFPRVLARYAGEGAPLSRHEAVHRMSGASARRFGVPGGVIEVGAPASFQIIRPAVYGDRADFAEPRAQASGIDHVFLSGRLTGSGHNGGRLRRVGPPSVTPTPSLS